MKLAFNKKWRNKGEKLIIKSTTDNMASAILKALVIYQLQLSKDEQFGMKTWNHPGNWKWNEIFIGG